MIKLLKLFTLLFFSIGLSTVLEAQMTLEFNTNLGSGTTVTLPLYGTVNVTVDWGDGSSTDSYTTAGDKTHTYGTDGSYTVNITGTLTQFGHNGSGYSDAEKLVTVSSFGNLGITSLNGAFMGTSNLDEVPVSLPSSVTDLSNSFRETGKSVITGLNNWDVSNITDMGYMFYKATSFNQDIGSWNVSKVTNMSAMFGSAPAFNQDIGNWDVGKVTNMSYMFLGASAFNQNINNWNVSEVTNMSYMFANATAFNQNISSWDVGKVTNMSHLFENAQAFNQDIGSWNVSSVTSMTSMFYSATAFNQNVERLWNVNKVTNMSYMFYNASAFNQNIGSWDVSNVTDMSYMFSYATDFNQDISSWDVSKVTNMDYMFGNTQYFNQDIGGWDVSNVSNMSHMFYNARAFNRDINSWTMSNVTDISYMFYGATAFNSNINSWDLTGISNMTYLFGNAHAFNQNINSWDVSNVTNMSYMFYYATDFNQDISSWDVSNVTNMSHLFDNAQVFNQDIGSWNVDNVTNMSYLFASATAFNQNISSWHVDKVTNMSHLFDNAQAFNQDIGSWNVDNVTNMEHLFNHATGFNQDISLWDVSNVTNMTYMFADAYAFNQDIGNWIVSGVTNMSNMFNNAVEFEQNIGNWDVSSVTDMSNMFSGVTLSVANYDSLLIGWDALNLQSNVIFNGGNSKYSSGQAETARNHIISNDNWTITDGGLAPPIITWNGSVDSDWNTPGNWDLNIVPTSAYNIIIENTNNNPVISTSETGDCIDLTVNSGATLTINSGGSLITNGIIDNYGIITIKRTVNDGEWHFISPPNNVTAANTFLGDYLQTWDETTATWSDIISPSTALAVLKGYSLWGVPKGTTYSFSGTPNTGNQSCDVTYTEIAGSDYDGANLLGNPYPSSIDWSNLDDSWGAIYYYNGTGYISWNNGTGSGSQYVPPMQGFFIVTTASGTFSLTNADRTHSGATGFTKSSKINGTGIVLQTSSSSYNDELYILFKQETSENFDLQYDAYKIVSLAEGVSQLYTITPDNKKLSIDARPECEVIQLGFSNNKSGSYSIRVKEQSGISKIVIEDTKTDTFYDFNNGDYRFNWNTTDNENRFKLHLSVTGTDELPSQQDNIIIYSFDKQIYVKAAKKSKLLVSDITGRVIVDKNIRGGELYTIPIKKQTGIYAVIVENKQSVTAKKVFIQ